MPQIKLWQATIDYRDEASGPPAAPVTDVHAPSTRPYQEV